MLFQCYSGVIPTGIGAHTLRLYYTEHTSIKFSHVPITPARETGRGVHACVAWVYSMGAKKKHLRPACEDAGRCVGRRCKRPGASNLPPHGIPAL
eukprot:577950-Prymnesium_polylepis.1